MSTKQLLGCLGLLLAVAGTCLLSLQVGARDIPFATVLASFAAYQPGDFSEVIIRTLRWPRLLAGVICGTSFAVAGALMQGITNNPMASPSILGINSGASFGLALAMILVPTATLNQTILFSFLGAAGATGVILLLASRLGGRATPVYLALAGTAISAVFTAITQMLVVFFDVAQDLSYWTAGGISGIRLAQILWVAPWTVAGLGLAIGLSRQITLLSFGDEVATGLGANRRRTRILAGLAVLILSGSAVALAGPIGFVGLVTPHMVRKLVGIDYQKVVPVSALAGTLLVVWADLAGRVVNPPYETPLGAVTALIGVPFFIYLANRERRRG
ncbi:MAG: FecCD family ABC transporter permease [Acidaminococcus sp.]|uniref:FecCD family ABC transporter permease n=1 Tax=Acidaminococcus sp. TaxID=1872103 RepID=UPI003F176CF0